MRFLQTLSLLLILVTAGLSSPPTVQAAPPALSLVPTPGTIIAGASAAQFEFPAQASGAKPLVHTFQLRNSTRRIQTIERVAVSCDCVQVEINETRSLPVKLLPGQTVPVQVTLRLDRSVPGPVSKSAWIYLHGDQSGLRLEMRGIVRDTPASAQAALMPARPLGL